MRTEYDVICAAMRNGSSGRKTLSLVVTIGLPDKNDLHVRCAFDVSVLYIR